MGSRPFASTRHKRDGHGADKETQRLPHFRPGPDEWLPLPSGPWASAERLMRRNRLVCFGPTVQSRRTYCFRCAGYPLELSLQKPAFLRNTSQRVMTRRFPSSATLVAGWFIFPRLAPFVYGGRIAKAWTYSGNRAFANLPFSGKLQVPLRGAPRRRI